jgi:hypothetical protein
MSSSMLPKGLLTGEVFSFEHGKLILCYILENLATLFLSAVDQYLRQVFCSSFLQVSGKT